MTRATLGTVRASDGRPVPAANLHVTLAFLGSVPERRLAQLAAIARRAVVPLSRGSASVAAAEAVIELVFDRLEYWRAEHLLCALPERPPASVAALATGLQERLTESGFTPDLESSWSVGVGKASPFRPHVTLARKVHRAPRIIEMQPVTWSFTDFVLVDSKTLSEGVVYTVLEKFALER